MGSSFSTPPPKIPSSASPQLSLFSPPLPWLNAFWKFSRPHTIVGTSLSVIGVFAVTWTLVLAAVPPAAPLTQSVLVIFAIAGLLSRQYLHRGSESDRRCGDRSHQ